MEHVPFVDVVGDDRIQAILDDPATFNLVALRAETIVDWIPDLGTYTSPSRCCMQNGLHRTPGLARSGLPAVLRHRFWEPDEAAAIVGRKFIGLLIYDSEDDDYTFELSSGADPIGALRPWRHDNRRHLLVMERPVEILGGHIPFQVRALGTGLCYLESVLFLPGCPEPSTYAPTIARLQARLQPGAGGDATAEVHFVTAEAATAQVEAEPAAGGHGDAVHGQTVSPQRLHAVSLPDLIAGSAYRVTVTATERGGAQATASLSLQPLAAAPAAHEPLRIPVEVVRTGDGPAAGLPMTFGVPVAQGRLVAPASCTLHCQGEALSGQARVHARWPDGSARWVLVDTPGPRALRDHSRAPGELTFDASPGPPACGLRWQVDAEAIQVESSDLRATVAVGGPLPACIERRTAAGGWQLLLGAAGPCLTAELGNGLRLANGPLEGLTLEEAGAERAVIRYEVPLLDAQGVAHFHTTVRLHIYAAMPFVRVQTRTVVTSPALAPAFGGQNLDHLTSELEYLRAAVDGDAGEATSLLLVRSLELGLPVGWTRPDERRRVLHAHDRGYHEEDSHGRREVAGRHPGVFVTGGHEGRVALCVKHFWQACPKAVRVDGDRLALEILPRLPVGPLPDADAQGSKLYSWHSAGRGLYRLKAGMALTVDALIGPPRDLDQARGWQAWLAAPPMARPDLDYLNATGALLPLVAKASSPFPAYEARIDRTLAAWLAVVDERNEYGFANYGDTYSDAEWFWSNNEYDATLCHYVEFLRGGEPGWATLGSRTARHLADVDTCNHSQAAEQVGAQYTHIPGHAGGYLPPYFRCKIAGSSAKPSHSWVEGAVLHYLLTGDETMRPVLAAAADQFTRDLAHYDFFNARECGWHLIHLCSLARLDDDPRPLNAATIIVEEVLGKQAPGGGWEHPLSEAHCHCAPPRCHGEAGFMVGVLLSGLRRYHALTGDPRVAAAIVVGARWLVRRTFDADAGGFRYTSCPNRKTLGGQGRQLLEGLALAQRLAPDPAVAVGLESVLAGLRTGQDAPIGPDQVGRNFSMDARYVLLSQALLAGAPSQDGRGQPCPR